MCVGQFCCVLVARRRRASPASFPQTFRTSVQDGFRLEMRLADSLLKEQLARLRGSWRNESHHQSRAANEASKCTAGGRAPAATSLKVVEADRQWLAGQEEARVTDGMHRRDDSYQQQLRELAHGSSHQQRYYPPPALPSGPSFSTPAPLMRAYQLQLTVPTSLGRPKRPAPPSPYQAPGESLGKRPCLGNPNMGNSSWPCREQWQLLVKLGLSRAPAGRLLLSPAVSPAVSVMPLPAAGSTLQERFAQHVMCRFKPMRPDELQTSLWVSCGRLINLLQPHAPTEVLQLGPPPQARTTDHRVV